MNTDYRYFLRSVIEPVGSPKEIVKQASEFCIRIRSQEDDGDMLSLNLTRALNHIGKLIALIPEIDDSLASAKKEALFEIGKVTMPPKPKECRITEFEGPEECRLKAHHTGDGWLLYVEDRYGETIAYLAWPKNWPESVLERFVGLSGFEIEP